MRNLRLACLLALALLSTLPAAASRGSWDDVKALYPGTTLVVRSNHRHACWLVAVDDAGIVCDSEPHDLLLVGPVPRRRFRVERTDIRSVRLAHSRGQTRRLRCSVGAALGVGLGAIPLAHPGNGGEDAIAAPLAFGLIGAGIGGLVGGVGPLWAGDRVYER